MTANRPAASWTGKVIGGVVGLFAMGPLGAVLGVALGHQYDESNAVRRTALAASFGDTFFATTFEVMGWLAKADGRVSEREIAAARAIMRELKLDTASVHAAIACFTRGKQPGFAAAARLAALRSACVLRPDLLRLFFDVQLRVALEGTDLAEPTRSHLARMAVALGISTAEFARAEAALRAQRSGAAADLAAAHAVLEVSPEASDAEVTRAYRRQLSRHHPDKLEAKGLPAAMLEHAKQRTQRILEAWERVRGARGIRA